MNLILEKIPVICWKNKVNGKLLQKSKQISSKDKAEAAGTPQIGHQKRIYIASYI